MGQTKELLRLTKWRAPPKVYLSKHSANSFPQSSMYASSCCRVIRAVCCLEVRFYHACHLGRQRVRPVSVDML